MSARKIISPRVNVKTVPIVVTASNQMKSYANEPYQFTRWYLAMMASGVSSIQRRILVGWALIHYNIRSISSSSLFGLSRIDTNLCDLMLNCPLSKKGIYFYIYFYIIPHYTYKMWKWRWRKSMHSTLHHKNKTQYNSLIYSHSSTWIQNDIFEPLRFHSFVSGLYIYHFQIEMKL